jgi:hypothetical protein
MSEVVTAQSTTIVWTELRDERGKLCARLETRLLLLELHRNHEWVIFDLRDYLTQLQEVSLKGVE